MNNLIIQTHSLDLLAGLSFLLCALPENQAAIQKEKEHQEITEKEKKEKEELDSILSITVLPAGPIQAKTQEVISLASFKELNLIYILTITFASLLSLKHSLILCQRFSLPTNLTFFIEATSPKGGYQGRRADSSANKTRRRSHEIFARMPRRP